MVSQGDIIKVSFDPQKGHEQAIICPITNTNNKFPLHIPLDNRTQTTGVILCEHVKALDLNARPHTVVEQLPKEILTKVINVVFSEIEQI